MKTNIKLEKLDFCKGIGISLIVLYHLFHQGENIFNSIGWEGVHIFIVLSGFGLTYSCLRKNITSVNSKKWFIERFKRILPAYWITCLLGFLFILLVKLNKLPSSNKIYSPDLHSYLNTLFLDLFTLQNFNFKTIFYLPNDHLWFIPFIVSFYLVFPFLYYIFKTKNIVYFMVSLILIEIVYRAISIYFLDGIPIGHKGGLGLNNLPDFFIFQKSALFGFFPSRLGEFSLGMLGAHLFVNYPLQFDKLMFRLKPSVMGVIFFLLGNILRLKLWGWIFSDFFIALGLILICLNLASFLEEKFNLIFKQIVHLGILSYYIYLIHMIVIRIFNILGKYNISSYISSHAFLKEGISILGTLFFTYLFSCFLRDVDQKINSLSFLNKSIN
jgi:peptidoglycan/LPS O-acetylase OafA/YrhL